MPLMSPFLGYSWLLKLNQLYEVTVRELASVPCQEKQTVIIFVCVFVNVHVLPCTAYLGSVFWGTGSLVVQTTEANSISQ